MSSIPSCAPTRMKGSLSPLPARTVPLPAPYLRNDAVDILLSTSDPGG